MELYLQDRSFELLISFQDRPVGPLLQETLMYALTLLIYTDLSIELMAELSGL